MIRRVIQISAQLQRDATPKSTSAARSARTLAACIAEQAVQMANEAGAHFIMPVHHQTLHEPVSVRNRTSPPGNWKIARRDRRPRVLERTSSQILLPALKFQPAPWGADFCTSHRVKIRSARAISHACSGAWSNEREHSALRIAAAVHAT